MTLEYIGQLTTLEYIAQQTTLENIGQLTTLQYIGQLTTLLYIEQLTTLEYIGGQWTIGVGLRMSNLDSNVAGSIPASICFLLEQETLSALLQSTQL